MPSKKKKYNARFPAGRIKKIMQTDEEVGKVAQAVPVIISRTLELFVESLLTKSAQITQARNAKTLTPSHMKQCILSESRFDFLKDLVKNIPDASVQEDNEVPLLVDTLECSTVTSTETSAEHLEPAVIPSTSLADAFSPKFYVEQGTSKSSTVIQYGSPLSVNKISDAPKMDFSIKSLVQTEPDATDAEPQIHIDLTNIVPVRPPSCSTDVPPLIPLPRTHLYTHQNTNDTLCIDEDYDN